MSTTETGGPGMNQVFLDGQFLPADQAKVSVMDRGFLFGDGVYEVIPVFAGRPFRLQQHLDRLDFSLGEIRLQQPWGRERWEDILQTLIDAHGGGDQGIYLQITRGVGSIREHRMREALRPTVFAMSRLLAPPPLAVPAPIVCVTAQDIRWTRCDIKSTSLLGHVLMTQHALDQGAQECLLIRDDRVWEGASSNLFAVIDGIVVTPPRGPFILAGITRDLLVELAAERGEPIVERPISVAELARASELWITSSTRELVPVQRLDGRELSAEPGPQLTRLWQWYRAYRDRLSRGEVR
ncbi:MAG TPA: aminotransferase class IV [Spongiibacteraceae bacterium]|nr:aminotransferase class IV [Spongiibacteraceae bacterium]